LSESLFLLRVQLAYPRLGAVRKPFLVFLIFILVAVFVLVIFVGTILVAVFRLVVVFREIIVLVAVFVLVHVVRAGILDIVEIVNVVDHVVTHSQFAHASFLPVFSGHFSGRRRVLAGPVRGFGCFTSFGITAIFPLDEAMIQKSTR
jgi:hypothetical protein